MFDEGEVGRQDRRRRTASRRPELPEDVADWRRDADRAGRPAAAAVGFVDDRSTSCAEAADDQAEPLDRLAARRRRCAVGRSCAVIVAAIDRGSTAPMPERAAASRVDRRSAVAQRGRRPSRRRRRRGRRRASRSGRLLAEASRTARAVEEVERARRRSRRSRRPAARPAVAAGESGCDLAEVKPTAGVGEPGDRGEDRERQDEFIDDAGDQDRRA